MEEASRMMLIKHGPKTGTPKTKTVEIPFKTKREFNPKLQPGEERVKQKDNREVRQSQHQSQ